ncbi:glycosyltransferase [Aestuariivirga sp.]|uniref:glycosyltransferase n=1 Tax=Aestuariivirga sp. TaxID=2650926 RepID=UPI0039E3BFE5
METQIRLLRSFGFSTVFAAVPGSYTMGTTPASWDDFNHNSGELGADEVITSSFPALGYWRELREITKSWILKRNAVHWSLAPAHFAIPSSRLIEILRKDDVALILANHVYTLPFAMKLRDAARADGKSIRVAVVTHDVQSHILLDRQASTPWSSSAPHEPALLRTELEWLEQADSLIHNSYQDHVFFSERLPSMPHHLMYPCMPKSGTPCPDQVLSRDLLFVGNNHSGNVASLKWYFDAVLPHFGSFPPRLTAIGNICEAIPALTNSLKDTSWLELIHEVDDLGPYYGSARAALGSTTSGRGISVKVIEAFAAGLPVVGTRMAFRGIPEGSLTKAGMIWADSARAFADLVRRAMQSELRDELRKAGDALYDEMFAPHLAADAFRKVIDQLQR